MKSDIEELLAFGQMDLEGGYLEYARGYYERVLKLDPRNGDATEGLRRIDGAAHYNGGRIQPIRLSKRKHQHKDIGVGQSVYSNRVLIGMGLLLLALVVVLLGSDRGGGETTTRSSFVAIGQKGRLYIEGADFVQVCVDQGTLDELARAVTAKDKYGFIGLLESGRVFSVPNNTKVLVLDLGGLLYSEKSKIRILEGLWRGKAGWVPQEWVVN